MVGGRRGPARLPSGALRAASHAIDAGVRLAGYFVWSLTGQFRVGLRLRRRRIVHVDYRTQRRTPKKSARWYAQVIRQNAVATNRRTNRHMSKSRAKIQP